MIQFSQETLQVSNLMRGKNSKLLRDQLLLGGYNAIIERLSLLCEHKGIAAPLLATSEQTELFHPVEQLRNVAFGDQKAIREFLLCDASGCPHMS